MLLLKFRATLLAKKLKQSKKKLAIAESCTGGMLASLLTSNTGASQFFDSAIITYSNEAKINLLNIDKQIIKKYGAVSEETAKAMSKGILSCRRTDYSLAITGIAGPKSDSSKKPIGLVYISFASKDFYLVKKFNFKGSRNKIRKLSCLNAMQILANNI